MDEILATDVASQDATERPTGEYVVIARRYRPQAFGELIGQEHVARALAAAIETSRVGHAYLFTGAGDRKDIDRANPGESVELRTWPYADSVQ